MKTITIEECAKHLTEAENVLILMHKSPDGDAIGCAYALAYALRKCGKQAMPVCSDPIPAKYGYITNALTVQEFAPRYIVTVDLADTQLFGDKLLPYKDRVDLCLDHHGSNTGYARYGFVDAGAGACTQIVKQVIDSMGVVIDQTIANAIFTGIVTDTGCFKYSNAAADSYRMAAEMMEYGAESFMINRLMFDTKSRQRLAIEKMALDSMKFYRDGQIAVIFLTKEMFARSGAEDSDTEGIAGLPRQIEGVKIGITVKEKEDGNYKISMRSAGDADVSAVCANFGGGGHKAAAGCTVSGTLEEVERAVVTAAGEAI